MLEHQALLYATKNGILAFTPKVLGDGVLALLPTTHVYGFVNNVTVPIALGATITYIDKLQGENILAAIKATKMASLLCVPRLIELLAAKIEQEIERKGPRMRQLIKNLIAFSYKIRATAGLNLGPYLFAAIHKKFGGHLKTFISGGSALEEKTFKLMTGLGFTIDEGYGLSETAGAVCSMRPNDRPTPGSMGIPHLGNQLKIGPVHEGQKGGEILIKGAQLMKGYFRNREATDNAMKDGWFHSGDLGHLDSYGHLFITGRIKEIIVTHTGQKAMPMDVERRYQGIPGVKELAVFGAPRAESTTQDIHAAIVVNEELVNELIHHRELYQHIVEKVVQRSLHVPAHLRISQVHLVNSIPKTSTLKVKRLELRKLHTHPQSQPTAAHPISAKDMTHIERIEEVNKAKKEDLWIEKKVMDVVENIARISKKQANNPLSAQTSLLIDLAFDSLTGLELALAIEEAFQIKLIGAKTDSMQTIGDLAAEVKRQLEGSGNASLLSGTEIASKLPETASPVPPQGLTAQDLPHSKGLAEPETPQKNTLQNTPQGNTGGIESPSPEQANPAQPLPQDLLALYAKTIELVQKIAAAAHKKLDKPINAASNFQSDLGFDSLVSLELVFLVEEEFKIRLSGDINQINTVEKLQQLIAKLTGHQLSKTNLKELSAETFPKPVPAEPALVTQEKSTLPIKDDQAAVTSQIVEITKNLMHHSNKQLREPIHEQTNFQVDLEFDSLLSLELVMEIERHFGVSLAGQAINQVLTIRQLSDLVMKLKRNNTHPGVFKDSKDQLHSALTRIEKSEPVLSFSAGTWNGHLRQTAEFFFRHYFQITSQGKDFIPQQRYILCANHASHLDVMSLILSTGGHIDDFAVLAAKDYFFKGAGHSSHFYKLLNLVPFDRDPGTQALLTNLMLSRQSFNLNKNLIIFPEGTRSLSGQLQSFKSFIGMLAWELQVPVLPACIKGTFELLPKGRSFPRKGPIHVAFGKPLRMEDYLPKGSSLSPTEIYQQITQDAFKRISELSS